MVIQRMATDKTHKTNGVFYLRRIYLRTKKNPNAKFISLSMEQAGKIIEQAQQMLPNGEYSVRQNSVRAAALILCIEPQELVNRLHQKPTKNYLNEISELKNRIKQLEDAGDKIAESASPAHRAAWVRAKSLGR
jgi:flagellin-specific chaperone FliS